MNWQSDSAVSSKQLEKTPDEPGQFTFTFADRYRIGPVGRVIARAAAR